MILLFFTILFATINCKELTISMPEVQTKHHDQYLCTSIKLSNESLFIKQFTVHSDATRAHHMILFGCDNLPSSSIYPNHWNCGSGFLCNGKLSIKYAWAKNAQPTVLPKDVGFEIGSQRSNVRYLVLQVHYAKVMKSDEYDHSSISLDVTSEKPKYLGGIHLLLSSFGTIPAHSPRTHIDVNCKYNRKKPIHVFAYRTHAHKLGSVITGYRFRNNSKPEWQMIAKGNPQWPQAFYPMEQIYDIQPNDYLVSRCTYNATNMDKDTKMGSTEKDEMCNLYLMYYVDSSDNNQYIECFDVQNANLVMKLPTGNDEPLPTNAYLENKAKGNGKTKSPSSNRSDKITTNTKLSFKGQEIDLKYPNLGQITAVTMHSDGNIFIFHRGSRIWDQNSFDNKDSFNHIEDGAINQSTILLINSKDFSIIKEAGSKMFYMPHGLTFHDGFLWVTDVAMHQVKKFKWKDGDLEEVLSLGEEFNSGSDSNHFCKPTSVAVSSNGEFYVADGYCNSRIMKFSQDGKMLAQFGYPTSMLSSGSNAPAGSFYIPHKVVLVDNLNLICVADRENKRVQCFKKNDNKFNNMIKSEHFGGGLFSIAFSPSNGLLFGVNGGFSNYPVKLFAMNVSSSSVISEFSPNSKKLSMPHDLTVSDDGKNVYIVEIGPNKLWKFSSNYIGNNSEISIIKDSKKIDQKLEKTVFDSDKGKKVNSTISEILPSSRLSITLTILALIAIPVLILIIISVIVQMRKRGYCLNKSNNKDQFSVGNFLNRHKGFNRVSTQEDDLDAIESSDSDVEEFSVNKTKA